MSIPIVTLDKIYIKPDEENVYFLDCTRVSGSKELISRGKEKFRDQIIRIARTIKSNKIVLADDVVFSGEALRKVIKVIAITASKVKSSSATTSQGATANQNELAKLEINENIEQIENVEW